MKPARFSGARNVGAHLGARGDLDAHRLAGQPLGHHEGHRLHVLPAGVGAQGHAQRNGVARPHLLAGQRHRDDLGEVAPELDLHVELQAVDAHGGERVAQQLAQGAHAAQAAQGPRGEPLLGEDLVAQGDRGHPAHAHLGRQRDGHVGLVGLRVGDGGGQHGRGQDGGEPLVAHHLGAEHPHLRAGGRHPHLDGQHGRAQAQVAHDAGGPVLHDGTHLGDGGGQLEGAELAGDEGVHLAGHHGQVHLAHAEHGVAEGEQGVALDPGDGPHGGGVHVAADELHAHRAAGHQRSTAGRPSCGACRRRRPAWAPGRTA